MASTSTSVQHTQHHNVELFGEPEELDIDRLPTYGEILRHYFFMYYAIFNENKHISYKDITSHVTDKVIGIWQRLPIQIIQRRSVFNKLNRFINEYKEATKSTSVLEEFACSLKNVFNVSKCRCNLVTSNCICGGIQLFMKTFMLDQFTNRQQTISAFIETLPQPSLTTRTRTTVTTEGNTSDDTWQPSQPDTPAMDVSDVQLEDDSAPVNARGPYVGFIDLFNFAMQCDRFGVSDRAAAALSSALMKDFDIKDKNKKTLVIDKSRVQRERNRCRNEILKKRFDSSTLLAFSFDSRKDESLVTEIINNKPHTRKIKEPHMVVLREPDCRLIGHIVLEAEDAQTKTRQLINFFENNNLPLDNLIAICSDGEPVNTGNQGGIIRLFEKHLQRELHWSVCLLHFNELPFRHLYNKLEHSTTKGPKTSTGLLAAILDICDTVEVRSI